MFAHSSSSATPAPRPGEDGTIEGIICRAVREVVREELAAALAQSAPTQSSGMGQFVSVATAAQMTDTKPKTLREYIHNGTLRAYRPAGASEYRIAVADLEAWVRGGVDAERADPLQAANEPTQRRFGRAALHPVN